MLMLIMSPCDVGSSIIIHLGAFLFLLSNPSSFAAQNLPRKDIALSASLRPEMQ